MSEQKWLQCVGVNYENNTPIYCEYENSVMPVPKNWVFAENYKGQAVWSPQEAMVLENGVYSASPSAPLVPLVTYDVELNIPLTLEQQINALSFLTPNASMQTALNAWKKSLTTLLHEVGLDQKKLQILEEYVEETQKVIRTVDKTFVVNKQEETPEENIALVELFSALKSFQNKILKISDNENFSRDANGFLGILVGMVIGMAIGVLLLPQIVFFAWILGAAIGLVLTHYVVNNAIGVDAVDPKQKDFISNKLTEFGIFGNTPKHKARTFLDAIRKEMGSPAVSETRKVEPQEVSGQAVAPMPAPVLMPVYLGISQ